jgi:hypothetical protein
VSEGEAPDAVPLAPPKKRKKKRTIAAEPVPVDRREFFPKFAESFPDYPALSDLVEAFEQGNYARVREGAQKLLDQTKRADASKETRKKGEGEGEARGDTLPHPLPASAEEREAIRRAARELLRRIEPDPLAIYMLVGSVVLLVFLSFWYWTHPHIPTP